MIKNGEQNKTSGSRTGQASEVVRADGQGLARVKTGSRGAGFESERIDRTDREENSPFSLAHFSRELLSQLIENSCRRLQGIEDHLKWCQEEYEQERRDLEILREIQEEINALEPEED